MTLVCILWTVLSTLFTLSCLFSAFSPFWFDNIPTALSDDNSSFVSFGLVRYCSKKQLESVWEINEWRDSSLCSFYNIFNGIPSLFWKVSFVLYGVAVLLLVVAIVLAHVSCCCKFLCERSVFGVAGICQLIAVILLTVSLLLYPFGLNSSFVRTNCGAAAGIYYSASCQIAWGYALAITTAALLVFCPVFAWHLMLATPRSKATIV